MHPLIWLDKICMLVHSIVAIGQGAWGASLLNQNRRTSIQATQVNGEDNLCQPTRQACCLFGQFHAWIGFTSIQNSGFGLICVPFNKYNLYTAETCYMAICPCPSTVCFPFYPLYVLHVQWSQGCFQPNNAGPAGKVRSRSTKES